MSAKSRLSTQRLAELQHLPSSRDVDQRKHRTSRHQLPNYFRFQQVFLLTTPHLREQLKRLYLIVLALPGYIGTVYILRTIPPESIAHSIFPYSFVPLQLSLFWGNFWALTWILLNTGRALRVATLIVIILALHLQNVELQTTHLLATVICSIALEMLVKGVQKNGTR